MFETNSENIYISKIIFPFILVSALAGSLVTTISINKSLINPLSFTLILGVVLVSLVWIGYHTSNGYPFHPLYVISLTFGIGVFLRSMYFITGTYEIMVGFNFENGTRYLQYSLTLVIIGLICLLVGYHIQVGKILAEKLPIFKEEFNKKRFWFIIVAYVSVGITIYLIFIKSGGGLTFSLSEFTTKRRSEFQGLRVSSRLIYVATYLWFLYICVLRRKSILMVILWFPLLIISLLIPLESSSRKDILAIGLVITIIFHHFVHRLRFSRLIVILLLLIAFSMAILSQRNQKEFNVDRLLNAFSVENILEYNLGRHDFADMTTISHIIQYLDNGNRPMMGSTIFTFFVKGIPRAIWPDKPVNLGIELSQMFYDEALGRGEGGYAGTPPSIIAELYLNFHVFGVMVGMIIFGVLIRLSFEYLRLSPKNPWTVLIFGITLLYIFEQSNATISGISFRYLQFLIPVTVAALFVSGIQRNYLSSKTKSV